MTTESKNRDFVAGVEAGIPIALGYFASAITIGIMAVRAGVTPGFAVLTSVLLNASAGEYAFFTTVAAAGSYLEMAMVELIANIRYLLMSCVIGQIMSPEMKIHHRMIVGFDLTDELFGVSIARNKPLTLKYGVGMMVLIIPGWALGTLFGAILGNALPAVAVTSLGMGLYGMFLATVIPAAKKSKVIFAAVISSMALSLGATLIPWFANLSSGVRIILITLVVSTFFALVFPIKDEEEDR